ncbi:MAG: AmmeMemoRadiSam system protein B [Gemmatimonadetes bacterium]|nr:AmmeMemoRadiSam system protein B [Gemmatimonadota bacterium]
MRTRRPAVAGLFYPARPAALLTAVQTLLGEVDAAPAPAVAAVAPHAGYVYSGRTAAEVFARLVVPRRCVVVAPNHTGRADAAHGGSVFAVGVFLTPMGDVPVDETLAAALLARCVYLEDDPAAHLVEHAVEVELPFLLARRPDVAVVPVVVGWDDWPRSRALGEALAAVVRESSEPVLLVASSDMNHYESAAVGERKDRLALAEIERLDGERLLAVTRQQRVSMCGRVPAAAVLHAARLLGATRGELVHYSHAGMATGDDRRVVGYAGVIVR